MTDDVLLYVSPFSVGSAAASALPARQAIHLPFQWDGALCEAQPRSASLAFAKPAPRPLVMSTTVCLSSGTNNGNTTAVNDISNVVLMFSDPSWSDVGAVPSTIIRNITALQMGYSSFVSENITVLSSRYASTQDNAIQGLLYIPDLDPSDPCDQASKEFIPDGAVRQRDLPPTNYNLIAIAPWFNPNCTKAFLASARVDPLRAFIFYKPGNFSHQPPPATSPAWNLGDEGRWKTQNHFPILAVTGRVGTEMVRQLGSYSGNLSHVPDGDNITTILSADPDDYVRIWTEIDVTTESTLPSIWVFVVIVLCVLLTVIGGTSLLMHVVQARRRASLRRRVKNGEINLEGMGIKRATVPRSHVETFPLFTYSYEPEVNSPPTSPTSPQSPQRAKTRISRGRSGSNAAPTLPISEKGLDSPFALSTIATDYQPTCAICLENYQNRVTIIRELPCGHIFHPECIDEFLTENSSLCPLCKACMLPKGFCPRITNAMVRRERAIRRLRDRVRSDDIDMEIGPGRGHSWGSSIKKHVFKTNRGQSDPRRSTSTELQPRRHRISRPENLRITRRQQSTEDQEGPTDLARERMRQLAGSDIGDDESQVGAWRRLNRQVFPGFW